MSLLPFAPHERLAARLLPHSGASGTDGSHDLSHLTRVWTNTGIILSAEGGDSEILLAAVLLHDCVSVEKNAPQRAAASTLSAERARAVLRELGWPADRIAAVAHAVEAHSFSADVAAETLEARILKDADRLDAIGTIGIARCFYVAGRMGSALYDPGDPAGDARRLNDGRYAIDHFAAKLFKLAEGFETRTGRRLAAERAARLRDFYDAFMGEIGVYSEEPVVLKAAP